MMPKVIGVDPGLADTGVGIVNGRGVRVEGYAYGHISTNKQSTLPERLHRIFFELGELIEEHRPDLVVVEDVFFLPRNPKSGIILGKVIGVILLAGYLKNVPVTEIPVREAKQVLTGNGNADKYQLEMSVRQFLNQEQPIKPFHASDAMSLALIGLFRYQHKLQQALP